MEGFERYGSIEYRMDTVELPETLKVAGVTSKGHPNFENIGIYHDEYKPVMEERFTPYAEIGLSSDMGGKWDYVFGCRVDSLDGLPEGLTGIDTGFNRFAVITFRSPSAEALVGGADGPGEGMRAAGEYIERVWLPEHKGEVPEMHETHMLFRAGECWLGMIEVYPVELDERPEMCFYIPLRS